MNHTHNSRRNARPRDEIAFEVLTEHVDIPARRSQFLVIRPAGKTGRLTVFVGDRRDTVKRVGPLSLPLLDLIIEVAADPQSGLVEVTSDTVIDLERWKAACRRA